MKLPQLTIRDLFWLMLAFAFAAAWWREHERAVAATGRAEKMEAKELRRSLEYAEWRQRHIESGELAWPSETQP